MKRSLFDINEDLFAIVEQINELGDSEEDQLTLVQLNQQLSDFRMEFQDKISQWVKMDLYQDSIIESIENEIERLGKMKTRLKSHKDRRKQNALALMQQHGLRKAGNPGHQFRMSSSHSVVVVDEDQVDRDFINIKETIHVDKKGIRSYIKDTGDVPDGVEFVQRNNVVVVK